MWRTSPKNSKTIVYRKIITNDEKTDEYNHPIVDYIDTTITVELYPYSDIIKREAFGIINEKAYTVITTGFGLSSHDVFVVDGIIYRINAISAYEPMQLVISSTEVLDEQH